MSKASALLRWFTSQIVSDVPVEIHACEQCRETDCSPERMRACALRAEAEAAEREQRGMAPRPDPAAADPAPRPRTGSAPTLRVVGASLGDDVESDAEDLPQESEQQLSHIRPIRGQQEERGDRSSGGAGATQKK